MHTLGAILTCAADRVPAVQSLIVTVLHADRPLGDRIATCGNVAAYVKRLAEIVQIDPKCDASASVTLLLPGVTWCLPARCRLLVNSAQLESDWRA